MEIGAYDNIKKTTFIYCKKKEEKIWTCNSVTFTDFSVV